MRRACGTYINIYIYIYIYIYLGERRAWNVELAQVKDKWQALVNTIMR
jgi:hypothetical protein